jgi:hypothetical protein
MVDPTSGAVQKSVAAIKHPVALASGANTVYALSGQGRSLMTLDPSTGKLRKAIRIKALKLGPAKRTVLEKKVVFSSHGRKVVIRFTFGGVGFEQGGFTTQTRISAGPAWFSIRQPAITSRFKSKTDDGVTVTASRARGHLVVRFKAPAGAFVSMTPTKVSGHVLVYELTRKPKVVPRSTTKTTTTYTQPTSTYTQPTTTYTQPTTTYTQPTTTSSSYWGSCIGGRQTFYRNGRPVETRRC